MDVGVSSLTQINTQNTPSLVSYTIFAWLLRFQTGHMRIILKCIIRDSTFSQDYVLERRSGIINNDQ